MHRGTETAHTGAVALGELQVFRGLNIFKFGYGLDRRMLEMPTVETGTNTLYEHQEKIYPFLELHFT